MHKMNTQDEIELTRIRFFLTLSTILHFNDLNHSARKMIIECILNEILKHNSEISIARAAAEIEK